MLHYQPEIARKTWPALQPKLKIGEPGDRFEREADAVADRVMHMQDGESLRMQPLEEEEEMMQMQPLEEEEELLQPKIRMQTGGDEKPIWRTCAECEEEVLQAKPFSANSYVPARVSEQIRSSRGKGVPLPGSVNRFMSNAIGADFAQVRIHTGTAAAQMNKALHAKAFTHGSDIYFNRHQYRPETSEGKRLLAHELAHTVQQREQSVRTSIQRDCSDPTFCTPYESDAQALLAEAELRAILLPLINAWFGTEVHDLWESFLSRSPGASLTRTVFDTPGNPVVDSFAAADSVEDDQEAVLDLVASRLSRFPGRRLRPHVYTGSSLTNYLSSAEMNNRPIDFGNPFTIRGNIAGGIGSSSAGPDYRKIARASVSMEKVPLIGNSGYIWMQLTPFYEVYDAVDFCPGACGLPFLEQRFTVPLSRLEASGRAFDVPYVVKFQPPSESKRYFFRNLPL